MKEPTQSVETTSAKSAVVGSSVLNPVMILRSLAVMPHLQR